jgi:hypothetical protein
MSIRPSQREIDLVLGLVRSYFGMPLDADFLQDGSPHLDWEIVLKAAGLHGVAPLCWWVLKSIGKGEPWIEQAREVFAPAWYSSVYRSLRIQEELSAILERFSGEGITPVLLKGLSLIHRYYPEAAIRPMGDLDLMVKEAELDKAQHALLEMGYSMGGPWPTKWVERNLSEHLRTFHAKGKTIVEIHFGLSPRSRPLFMSEEEIWNQLQPVSINGRTAMVLDPLDELVYLTSHITKHELETYKLLWFFDLSLIYCNLNPKEKSLLLQRLQDVYEGERILEKVESALFWFMGKNPKGPVLNLKDVIMSPLTLDSRVKLEPTDHLLDHLQNMSSTADKIRLTLSYLFPTMEYIRSRHRINSPFGAFLWRFIRPFWSMWYFIQRLKRTKVNKVPFKN